jgi:hypothetical protein
MTGVPLFQAAIFLRKMSDNSVRSTLVTGLAACTMTRNDDSCARIGASAAKSNSAVPATLRTIIGIFGGVGLTADDARHSAL